MRSGLQEQISISNKQNPITVMPIYDVSKDDVSNL